MLFAETFSLETFSFKQKVEELVNRVLQSRKISRADQMELMNALNFQELLNEQEKNLISRVFHDIRQGLVVVVD